jgi:SAM-dependent methyltransferase
MQTNYCLACNGGLLEEGRCQACGWRPARIRDFDAYAPHLVDSRDSFDPALHVELAKLEAGNFWFRARNQLIVHALKTFSPGMRTFLEIGCGTGFVLKGVRDAFPTVDAAGSELFVEALGFASNRLPGVQFMQMDARHIPFRENLDVVGAFDVIEHIQDDEGVLREIHLALRPGGTLVLTVPQHRWLWSEQDDYAHHVRRYTRHELQQKLRGAGFQVAWQTSFVSLLLPMMLLSRLGGRAGENPDPFREFRIPRWLDAMLFIAMRVELGMIKIGLRMPAGGSLMMVAKKALQ